MNKHIAVYRRVSTGEQTLDLQANDLRFRIAEFEANGLEVRFYDDHFTGTTMNRPGWNKLDAELKAGRISAILVWRIDRLGRTASGLTKLFDDLVDTGVNLISHKESIDLSTPAGRLLANVIASVASYETEVRRERQTAGIAAAKAKGKTWGGSTEKSWMTKATRRLMPQVIRLDAEGHSQARIASLTGLNPRTVSRVLKTVVARSPEEVLQS